jgi:hypothetical protein
LSRVGYRVGQISALVGGFTLLAFGDIQSIDTFCLVILCTFVSAIALGHFTAIMFVSMRAALEPFLKKNRTSSAFEDWLANEEDRDRSTSSEGTINQTAIFDPSASPPSIPEEGIVALPTQQLQSAPGPLLESDEPGPKPCCLPPADRFLR